MTNKKPILCLDFDGVCHSYKTPWEGTTILPDPPVDGLFHFLEKADDIFDIHIYSARSASSAGRHAMSIWFDRWWPSEVERVLLTFPKTKPPAFVGLDDRVLTFTGIWPEIDVLKNFVPWNKKGV